MYSVCNTRWKKEFLDVNLRPYSQFPPAYMAALITGITGQDGSYLAELLLARGWLVHGLVRRASVFTTERIDHIREHPRLHLQFGDVTDLACLCTALGCLARRAPPDVLIHVYHLAAQSHVGVSFVNPVYTANADAIGTLNVLEAIRALQLTDRVRMYQASTSELFGKVCETPQNERTPFYPRSPYAAAKLYAYWIVRNYREAYGMWCCNGILFNHESPRRGKTFVTRKITQAVARITFSINVAQDYSFAPLLLGNINAMRDWGHARDYVRGMVAILEHDTPDDYVLATGECHSVREFVSRAFAAAGHPVQFVGEGLDEVAVLEADPDVVVMRVDPGYFRPAEVDLLCGDASKAARELGWAPTTTFEELVTEMTHGDLHTYRSDTPDE